MESIHSTTSFYRMQMCTYDAWSWTKFRVSQLWSISICTLWAVLKLGKSGKIFPNMKRIQLPMTYSKIRYLDLMTFSKQLYFIFSNLMELLNYPDQYYLVSPDSLKCQLHFRQRTIEDVNVPTKSTNWLDTIEMLSKRDPQITNYICGYWISDAELLKIGSCFHHLQSIEISNASGISETSLLQFLSIKRPSLKTLIRTETRFAIAFLNAVFVAYPHLTSLKLHYRNIRSIETAYLPRSQCDNKLENLFISALDPDRRISRAATYIILGNSVELNHLTLRQVYVDMNNIRETCRNLIWVYVWFPIINTVTVH